MTILDEVVPHVYRIEAGYVNLYLCEEDDGLALIDTGMPKKQDLVWEAMAALGRQRSDLKHILITHADYDHAGSLGAIQAESGAKVYAMAKTAAFLQSGKSPKHMPWLIQMLMNAFIRFKPIPSWVIEIVEDGDILPVMGGLQVMATPGHTMCHHSFYSSTHGILFAGDALNTRDGRLQSTPPRITADQDAARQSAIRLLELAPSVIACGHGDPSASHSSDDLMKLFNQLRQK
ncbi:MAG: MBL fold metallo-hydrolase [Chloroflexi bacterium]|nr:MBL fold metallo-hydrolase [Chloroflexota bacterium]